MKKILISILFVGFCSALLGQTVLSIYEENFETWPLTNWINYNQLAADGVTEQWKESGDTALIIADPAYLTQHQWLISDEFDIPEQPIARGTITVTLADDPADEITVTINGTQGNPVTGATPTALATAIALDITNNIPDYTATSDAAVVSIVAVASGADYNGDITYSYANGGGGDGLDPAATDTEMTGGVDHFATGMIYVLDANHANDGARVTINGDMGSWVYGATPEILASNIAVDINNNIADYTATVDGTEISIISDESGTIYNGDITYTYTNTDGSNPLLDDTEMSGGISYDFSFKWKTSFFDHCNGTTGVLYTGNPINGWNNADIIVSIMQNPVTSEGSIIIDNVDHVEDGMEVTFAGLAGTAVAYAADSAVLAAKLADSINVTFPDYTAVANQHIITITAKAPGSSFNRLVTSTPVETDGTAPTEVTNGMAGGAGTWTAIWQEDDETSVSNSTADILTVAEGNDPWTYDDFNWYTSVFDLTSYNGTTIIFGFEYEGRDGNSFYLDSLLINEYTPPAAVQPTSPTKLNLTLNAYDFCNYTMVPVAQADNYGFSVNIRNNGIDLVENTYVSVRVNDENENEVFGNYQNVSTPFLEGQLKDFNLNQLAPATYQPNFISDFSIEFEVQVINDSAPEDNIDELYLSVTDSVYAIDNGVDAGGLGFDDMVGMMGSVFEIVADDHISSVSIFFNDDPAGEDEIFSFSLYEVTDWADTSTTGLFMSEEYVKTSGMLGGWLTYPLDYWPVEAGKDYIFVVNQHASTNLFVSYDDDGGDIIFDTGDGWQSTSAYGDLFLRLNMKNRAPEFASEPLYNSSDEIIAVQGKAFNVQYFDIDGTVENFVSGFDADGDDLQFLADADMYPGTYIPDWLTLVDNANGTASLSCVADVTEEDDLGDHEITIALTDGSIDTVYQTLTIKVIPGEIPYIGLPTAYEIDFSTWLPTGWYTEDDLLETGSTEHWQASLGETALIQADTEFEQSEVLYSRPVYIPLINNLGSDSIMFSFDWATNFEKHCGGTFGVLGSGNPVVNYNMADIIVYILDEDYNATQIWQEDDESLLEATNTFDTGTGEMLEWPYTTDTWYTSSYDLAAYTGQRIIVAFQYNGLDGDYFTIDNFSVSMIERPTDIDVKLEVNISTDYTRVPLSQLDDFYTLDVDVINRGIVLPEDSYLTAEVAVADVNHDFEYVDYVTIPAGFAMYDTVNFEFTDQFIPDAADTYTLTFNAFVDNDVNTANNENIQLTFIVDSVFALDNGSSEYGVQADTYDNNDGQGPQFIGGRLGNVFELNEDDIFTTISVYFDDIPADIEFDFSVYENYDVNNVTGTILFTTELFDRTAGSTGWATFNIQDLALTAGTYLFTINQVENQPFDIGQDDSPDGYFVRGWQDEDLWVDEEDEPGYLLLRPNFYDELNVAPEFVALTAEERAIRNNAKLNINYNYNAVADDENENDVLVFRAITLPDWLSFTDNGDRTATITGTPSLVYLGSNLVIIEVTDGIDTVSQSFNIIVEGNPQFEELEEDFAGGFGPNLWEVDWDKDADPESTTHWVVSNEVAFIESDIIPGPPVEIHQQYEWLISKTIYIPQLGQDSTIMLSFDWMNDFYSNCGGTFDVLGTGNLIDGFNKADIKVMITADDGNNWDVLWREDDRTTVQNTSTLQGETTQTPWPYASDEWYTTQLDITGYEGEMVKIAFYYEGRDGGDFNLDNVSVTKAYIEEFADLEIIAISPSDYTLTPFYQLQTYSVTAQVVNHGAELTDQVAVLGEVINTTTDDTLLFESVDIVLPLAYRDTQTVTFTSVSPMEEGTYNFDFSAYYINNISGALIESNTETFEVTAEEYALDDNISVGAVGVDNSGDALGNLFEVTKKDHLDSVLIYFHTNPVADLDFFMSVYKYDKATSTGTLVGNSRVLTKEMGVAGTWVGFGIAEIKLLPGVYAIMINQITDESIGVGYDDEGSFIKLENGVMKMDNAHGNLLLRAFLSNEVPEFVSEPVLEAVQGFKYTYKVKATDANNDIMTFNFTVKPNWIQLIDSVNGYATMTGTPGYANTGSNLVVFNVTDGRGKDTQSFIISIENNSPPEFISEPITEITEGENYGYTVVAKDTSALIFSAAKLPGWLTFTQVDDTSAILTGSPALSDVGTDTVSILASDGLDTTYQDFVIKIYEANIEPVFTSIPVVYATEGNIYNYNVKVFDADTADVLVIEADELPTWLSLISKGDATATLTGIPDESSIGLNNVSIFVHDGLDTIYQTFAINVGGNPAPVFTSAPKVKANEGELYTYNITASDANGESITISAVIKPAWLGFTDNGNGTAQLLGTPEVANIGDTVVKIQASDIYGNFSEQLFNLKVNANIAPVITTEPGLEVIENDLYRYEIRATDQNVTNTLTFAGVSLPGWLSLTDNFNGTALITGTPGAGDLGSNSVIVSVSDGIATVEQSFVINVIAANTPPEFTTGIEAFATEGFNYSSTIFATDDDGDNVTFTSVGFPTWLSIVNLGNNRANISGTPGSSNAGINSFSIRITDGKDAIEQQFSITVIGASSAPKFVTQPVTKVLIDSPYVYNILATVPSLDSLIFTVLEMPEWLNFDLGLSGHATLSGTPDASDIGGHDVVIRVTDGQGLAKQAFVIEVRSGVGVNEMQFETLNIYPNPVKNVLSIENGVNSLISICNATGEIVRHFKLDSKLETVDMSAYTPGIYYIRVLTDNELITKKIVLIK